MTGGTDGVFAAARHDPKGLIREAYRIDGISEAECRSILVDWALSLPSGSDSKAALGVLLGHYGRGDASHPMTALLRAGLAAAPERSGRRGGAAGRRQPAP